jgi:serine/threonine protein kinase
MSSVVGSCHRTSKKLLWRSNTPSNIACTRRRLDSGSAAGDALSLARPKVLSSIDMAKTTPSRAVETTFNRYALVSIVGEGGAGRVWRATDSAGKDVAIKILNADRATSERRKRFQNEILFCLKNTHANIVRVIDHGIDLSSGKATPFYVMPLLSGSFRRLLSAGKKGHLLRHFDQIMSGVEAAHLQGVVHRDLKPENVLVDSTGEGICVADFGIAHFADEELYTAVETAADARLANFQYAAPEQKTRGRATDRRTDICALGLMLNELFTGEIPHAVGYTTVSSVAPDYAWVDEIVAEMIQQDPGKRPSSIDSIKSHFISRKQDFVDRQRLSQIQNTVIPVGAEDDPLASEHPKIVDIEWKNGHLTLILDRNVTGQWIQAFQRMHYRSSLMGKEPASFQWTGRQASISAREHEVQGIIDHFKSWMPIATDTYREMRERERREAADREKGRLAAEREELERQRRIRESVRF